MFGKWTFDDIEVSDISLADYVACKPDTAVFAPHTAGRYAAKQFRKALCPIVERMATALMFHGRNSGKKLLAMRIMKSTLEIIHLLTDENPMQVRSRETRAAPAPPAPPPRARERERERERQREKGRGSRATGRGSMRDTEAATRALLSARTRPPWCSFRGVCEGVWREHGPERTRARAEMTGRQRREATERGGKGGGVHRRRTEGGGQRALLAAGRPVRCGRRTAAVVVWCPDCRPVATVVAPPSHRGGGRRQWDGGVGPRDLAEASASYIVGIVQWRRFEGRARGRLCGLSLGLGAGSCWECQGTRQGQRGVSASPRSIPGPGPADVLVTRGCCVLCRCPVNGCCCHGSTAAAAAAAAGDTG